MSFPNACAAIDFEPMDLAFFYTTKLVDVPEAILVYLLERNVSLPDNTTVPFQSIMNE
jgi:hypothetical protein